MKAIGEHQNCKNKKSFWIGAYDSNPYNDAYEFTKIFKSIDQYQEILVKYYVIQKEQVFMEEKAGTLSDQH